MFITKELLYIQMQKTGCTHITSLLEKLFTGEQIGKHTAATNAQINSKRYCISSIRNPWDWYLSLWTYGVENNGGLANRLTNKYYMQALIALMKNPFKHHSALLHERDKDVELWRNVYTNSADIQSFRQWIKLIHKPNNARWLGEGYGKSVIKEICGFMSYRYFYLCCSEPKNLSDQNTISNYNDLVEYDSKNCYIDFFIRQESLEKDFCAAIENIRPLSQEEKGMISSKKKTNTSKRLLHASDYYDQESVDLVYNREKLLIEKFGYSPP